MALIRFAGAWTGAAAQLPIPSDDNFQVAVDAIVASPTLRIRYEKASQLAGLAQRFGRTPSARIQPETAARIASLHDDGVAIVRMYAADAPGDLGPQASSTIPALKRAAEVEHKRIRPLQLDRRSHPNSTEPLKDMAIATGPDLGSSIERARRKITVAKTATDASGDPSNYRWNGRERSSSLQSVAADGRPAW